MVSLGRPSRSLMQTLQLSCSVESEFGCGMTAKANRKGNSFLIGSSAVAMAKVVANRTTKTVPRERVTTTRETKEKAEASGEKHALSI